MISGATVRVPRRRIDLADRSIDRSIPKRIEPKIAALAMK